MIEWINNLWELILNLRPRYIFLSCEELHTFIHHLSMFCIFLAFHVSLLNVVPVEMCPNAHMVNPVLLLFSQTRSSYFHRWFGCDRWLATIVLCFKSACGFVNFSVRAFCPTAICLLKESCTSQCYEIYVYWCPVELMNFQVQAGAGCFWS